MFQLTPSGAQRQNRAGPSVLQIRLGKPVSPLQVRCSVFLVSGRAGLLSASVPGALSCAGARVSGDASAVWAVASADNAASAGVASFSDCDASVDTSDAAGVGCSLKAKNKTTANANNAINTTPVVSTGRMVAGKEARTGSGATAFAASLSAARTGAGDAPLSETAARLVPHCLQNLAPCALGEWQTGQESVAAAAVRD
ncbi:MAG: hypothetical protein FWH15_08660 [Betaproteobacteria bacterium]|nr:hypothetical protein [Betaproteobacteria bacterium]